MGGAYFESRVVGFMQKSWLGNTGRNTHTPYISCFHSISVDYADDPKYYPSGDLEVSLVPSEGRSSLTFRPSLFSLHPVLYVEFFATTHFVHRL